MDMDMGLGTGVLLLQKSYGRDEKNRLLFQCVPHQVSLPTFLIPYHVKVGFQKEVVNKYVLFVFLGCWKRNVPLGVLRQVLGDVCSLTAYYDYLLYSFHLFRNTSWAKQPVELQGAASADAYAVAVADAASASASASASDDSAVESVFTIDNEGTVDFDDAFRFEILGDGTCCVTVYITDVASLVFTRLGVDLGVVCSGVSTLYLPHRRIPMLLDQISQQVRLVAGSLRTCVAVRFFYDFASGGFLFSRCEKQVRVRVERNWCYSEVVEGSCGEVGDLFRFTRRVGGSGFLRGGGSKDLVAFWMVQYNRFMAGLGGVCFRRRHRVHGDWMSRLLEQQEYSVLGGGEDLVFCSSGSDSDSSVVVPMTNPMRRQADLYNQALFLQVVSLDMGEGEAMASLLNLRMKAVAKIQRETHLLHFMEQRQSFEAEGVVYRMEPGLETNRWFVYLDLGGGVGGLFSSYSTAVCRDGNCDCELELLLPFRGRFLLFYFSGNHDMKKKIRVSPI